MSARFLAFVGLVLAALGGNAQQSPQETNVVVFEDFAKPGSGVLSFAGEVRAGGMIFSTLSAAGWANDFIAWRTNDSNYRGATALANEHSYGTILSRTNGAAFDFLGLDVAGFHPFHAGTVMFYGFRGFDCVASDSFTYTSGSFQTFRTAKLTNVTEIRWNQNVDAMPQFNNVTVVLDLNAPSAQPLVRFRSGTSSALDITGLMVNTPYVLERSSDSKMWERERTFSSSSTINFPGILFSTAPRERFFRVRLLRPAENASLTAGL